VAAQLTVGAAAALAHPLRGAAAWRQGGWRYAGSGLVLVALVTLVHLWLSSQLLADRWGFGTERDAATARMEVAFVRELQQAAPARTAPAPAVRRPAAVAAAAPASAAAAAAQRAAAKPIAPAQRPEAPPENPLPQPTAAPALAADLAAERAALPVPPSQDPSPALTTASTAANPADLAAPEPAANPANANTNTNANAAASSAPGSDDGATRVLGPAAGAGAVLPAAASFEWPPSTRLSYTLTGHYRGPVEGQARVEWLTTGGRYQVHLDASIGPSFAPLVTRRLSSEGALTAAGLAPRRYEEVTTAPLRAPRRVEMSFSEEQVRLANGSEVPRPPGLQDSASQFVQMTWLFTTQPQLLQPGRSVVMPLALPGRVEPWTYAVRAGETLNTPIGAVPTVHVQPQRGARPGDLTVEFWVAPTLQNLPVRILIRQDAENFIDLKLDRLPQQAGAK
jgi:Protein of unknown function (DUF3108)